MIFRNNRAVRRAKLLKNAQQNLCAETENIHRLAQEFGNIGNPAAYRLNPFRLNLGGFYAQRFADFIQAGVVEQRAVADQARPADILRVSGNFSAIRQDIISPAQFSWHAKLSQNLNHRRGEFLKIGEAPPHIGRDKAEI